MLALSDISLYHFSGMKSHHVMLAFDFTVLHGARVDFTFHFTSPLFTFFNARVNIL